MRRTGDLATRAWSRLRALPAWAQIGGGAFVAVAAAVGLSEAAEDDSPAPTSTTTAPTTTTTTLPPGLPAAGDDTTVLSITDGDTLTVAGGTRIRLIGIDTPEPPNCFAAEATARLRALLPPGTKVRLTYDSDRLDPFERTLAYVHRFSDGLFVNVAMAREGYARPLTVAPNAAHAGDIAVATTEAEQGNRGLWASCPTTTSTTTPTTTTTTTVAASVTTRVTTTAVPRIAPTTAATGGCHSSYTGACVPIASDVDCGSGTGNGPAYVYASNFSVVGPDVYGLDTDNDGIACED